MPLLKISMILLLVALIVFAILLLWYLLLGPLILQGIFGVDLDDIKEKRKREECVKNGFRQMV